MNSYNPWSGFSSGCPLCIFGSSFTQSPPSHGCFSCLLFNQKTVSLARETTVPKPVPFQRENARELCHFLKKLWSSSANLHVLTRQLLVPFTESNLNPERVPAKQSASVWGPQPRGGRDLPAPERGGPGPGEPQRGPQETQEGKAGANVNVNKSPHALPTGHFLSSHHARFQWPFYIRLWLI